MREANAFATPDAVRRNRAGRYASVALARWGERLDEASAGRCGSNGTLLEPTNRPTRRVAPRLGTRRGACRSRQQPDALRTQRSRGGNHALHAERRGLGDDLLAQRVGALAVTGSLACAQ